MEAWTIGPRFSVPGLMQLRLATTGVTVVTGVGEEEGVAVLAPVGEGESEGEGVVVAFGVPDVGDGDVLGVGEAVPFCKTLKSSEALRWLSDSVA